jgi:hypothetical protein
VREVRSLFRRPSVRGERCNGGLINRALQINTFGQQIKKISDIDSLTLALQPKTGNLQPVVLSSTMFLLQHSVGFLAMMVVWLNVYAYEVIRLSY